MSKQERKAYKRARRVTRRQKEKSLGLPTGSLTRQRTARTEEERLRDRDAFYAAKEAAAGGDDGGQV